MECERCGTQNADGTKFCKACGAPLPKELHTYGDNFVSNGSTDKNDYNDNISNAYDRDEFVQQSAAENNAQNAYYGQDNQYYSQNYSQDYQQSNHRDYGYQYQGYQNNGYGNQNRSSLQSRSTRSVGAIVIFMINGALALLSLLMSVLPSIDLQIGSDRYFNAFGYASRVLKLGNYSYSKTDIQVYAILIIAMFAVPMLFQLLWAIFSFTRVRAAGAMGLVGSIIYTTVSFYWTLFLLDTVKIGNFYYYSGASKSSYSMNQIEYLSKMMTSVPYLMITIGIVGIVLSSIEIAKRNRVR